MRRRRVIVGSVSAAVIVIAAVVVAGAQLEPSRAIERTYTAHRTFVSEAEALCVDSVARGTATANAAGWGPFVRYRDVALIDPVVEAAGYRLKAGRCDRMHRVRLSVLFEQTWSAAGASTSARRSYEGPAASTLAQYNDGVPTRLADAGFPSGLFDPLYTITGHLHVRVHGSNGNKDFSYRSRFTLEPDER